MGQGLIIEEETGKSIAVAYDEKDAPILAEAPAMLEALKDMLRLFDRGLEAGTIGRRACDEVKALIAKIEGE